MPKFQRPQLGTLPA